MEQSLTYFKLGGTQGFVSLWSVVCAHGEAVVAEPSFWPSSELLWVSLPAGVPILHPQGLA